MIRILSIGKVTSDYQPLISHFCKMIRLDLRDSILSPPKGMRKAQQIQEEARIFKKYITRPCLLIILDVTGKHFTSDEFANLISRNIDASMGITFVIGGAYGIDAELLLEADIIMSLSLMTLPHLLAKLTLIEQIYRAETIMRSHPYHK